MRRRDGECGIGIGGKGNGLRVFGEAFERKERRKGRGRGKRERGAVFEVGNNVASFVECLE